MIYKYISIFLFWSILFFTIPKSGAQNIYKQLLVSKCDSLISANAENPDFAILDVRTNGEWVGDHLEGSINRSTGDTDFEQRLNALPKHKIFLLHCQSGGRSAVAFAKMKNLGFAEVYEMKGGINSWKRSSYPTTSVHAPKLMLVNYTDNLENSSGADTIKITVTNRANDELTFSSATFNDFHTITNNFKMDTTLAGAEDYTFSVIHDPDYSVNDSTTIFLESNGGELEINIVFKNGAIQYIEDQFEPAELVLYPNPAENIIYIKGISVFDLSEVSVINLNGQTVLTRNEISTTNGIDISELKNGIYFARIKSGNNVYSKKIVIQH